MIDLVWTTFSVQFVLYLNFMWKRLAKNLQSYSQVPNKRDGNLKFFIATLFFLLLNLENFDGKIEAISNAPFMTQSLAESIKKIVRAIWDFHSNQSSQSSPICMKMGQNF